ncbi:unnamed protein product [Orchesella dallaii]|uniref:Protein takeout n=1 Tax=Orchesella dallaii TaxID=48710 RepID=A0ABP1PNE7_9HEXA
MEMLRCVSVLLVLLHTLTIVAGAAVISEKEGIPDQDLNLTSSSSIVTPIVSSSPTLVPSLETETTTEDADAEASDIKESSSVSSPRLDLSIDEAFGNETSSTPDEFDGPIRKCTQKNSAALNKCLQQVLKDLKPRLAEGVPEINLPAMEPLKLENVAFQQGSGPVRIVAEFTNVEVSGLSNFTQSDFWVDVPKKTLDFDLILPQLTLVGNYELSGNLFFIPIGGNGDFYLNLGGTRAKGVSKLGVFRNDTQAKVVVKKTDVSLEIETIKVHLTNLFNGDPLLGTVINTFLNENSQEVFEEIKPQIGTQVGELLSLLANRAMSALSTSQFDEVPFEGSPVDEEVQIS